MPFSYGFFDAKNRDRVYTAENFTSYLSSLICNGVLDTYGDCFAVTANNNMTVTVGTGKAWLNGHYFSSDTPYTVDLSSYVVSANRYVVIGICCDIAARECSLVVRAGVAVPNLANSENQTYLTIAAVHLPVGVSYILDTDITDCRDDESLCGYVKCILGKCGVSDLVDRMDELERMLDELISRLDELEQRTEALENSLGGGGGGVPGLSDLMNRLDELERRTEAMDNIFGIQGAELPIILHSRVAAGSASPVGDFTRPLNSLVGIVGSLDGLIIEEES